MKKSFQVALLVLTSVFLLGLPISAQQSDVGTVSGIVTVQDSGDPIMGAVVKAYHVNGHPWPAAIAWSDSTGNYELTVPYGDFHVKAYKWGFFHEWWEEAASREDATPVTVDEENSPEGINFTLTEFSTEEGSISGTVTDAGTTEPIENATIALHMIGNPFFHRMTHSLEDGSYLFENLPSGTYILNCFKEGYLPAEYPEQVEVNGDDITGIDFALEQIVIGGIAGTVTDATTDEPIAYAWIIATHIEAPHFHRWAVTNDDGEYTMEVPSGAYHIDAWAYGYLHGSLEDSVVVEDSIVTGVDIALMPIVYGSISGTVYDTITGETIAHALVEARIINGWHRKHTWSDSIGNYTLERLSSGDYRVSAFAHCYFPKVYPDTVTVEGDENVPGIDFYLIPVTEPFDGYIAGTVTDENTSEPVADALLVAFGLGPFHQFRVRFTRSGDDGSYIFENLPPVEFKVLCLSFGYEPEFFDDKDNWWDADVVIPDADNIDFALTASALGPRVLAGTVIEDDIPVTGALVLAKQDDEVIDISVTYPDGSYIFEGIESGNYTIEVLTPSSNEGSLENVTVLFSDVYDADIILCSTSVDEGDVNLPTSTTLMQNFPNPFNASTNISFNLANDTEVELTVYNLLGRKVATLVSGNMTAGLQMVTWDGKDATGNQVATGLYLYVLKTDDGSQSKQMLLLK